MNFQSLFSFEDAELLCNGGAFLSSISFKVADPQAKPFLNMEGPVKDCIELTSNLKSCSELAIKVDCGEKNNGPSLLHDAIPFTDASVPSDKPAAAYRSLDEILSPRYGNETGILFMDDEEAYKVQEVNQDATSHAAIFVPSDKLTSNPESLDEILYSRCWNGTGSSLMDDKVAEDGTRLALVDLLDELLESFADTSFQERLSDLVADACKRQDKPPLGFVAGRAELAREVQAKILPKYGFLGSKKGVDAMHLALKPYLNEELTLSQMFAADDLLWMPPGTTARDCKFTAGPPASCTLEISP